MNTYTKESLRKKISALLKTISEDERKTRSKELADRFLRSYEYLSAKTIGLYHPKGDEPDTVPLIKRGLLDKKQIVLPVVDGEILKFCKVENIADLVEGKFGIMVPPDESETISLDRIDLIMIPGLGFDPEGGRLGRGKGYYDKTISRNYKGKIIALAFSESVVDKIPEDPWDLSVNKLIYL